MRSLRYATPVPVLMLAATGIAIASGHHAATTKQVATSNPI